MKKKRNHPFPREGKQSNPEQPAHPSAEAVDLLLKSAYTHHAAGQLAEAESLYRQILQTSPDHPTALYLLGVIASQVGQFTVALELIDRAIHVDPADPGAHFSRGNVLFSLQQYQAAVESYDQALHLKPNQAEACNNRGSALHTLKQHRAAVNSYDQAIRLQPNNAEALYNRGDSLQALEQYTAALQSYDQSVLLNPDYAARIEINLLRSALKEVARIAAIRSKAEMKAELDALPFDLRSHPAVCDLRNLNVVKTSSGGKDLVFYCAPTIEIWNPQTVEAKGIGGSEEAVVWLSRLLHRRGWNVTVYCNCGQQEKLYDGVSWKPCWMWNRSDKQDVTVIWRFPELAELEINSDKIIVDLHDVISEAEFPPETLQRIHQIFVKSRFHRSLFPNIPDDKFVIVPNGIDAKLFEGSGDRDPLLLINTSSADRSLEAFLDCFEQIKQQVAGAKAQWAYGWAMWDANYSSHAQRLQWKTHMQHRMKQLGVEELGRISHDRVASLYRKANIFAYPSEMAETDCISLSKAMAAGAIPITTDFAALGEKSGHGGVFIHSKKTKDDWLQSGRFHFDITDPEQKAQFIREAVKLLKKPPDEDARESMREWARTTFDWNKIADSWNEVLARPIASLVPASATGLADRNA